MNIRLTLIFLNQLPICEYIQNLSSPIRSHCHCFGLQHHHFLSGFIAFLFCGVLLIFSCQISYSPA